MPEKSIEIFEWVVCSGDQKFYLTENQYEALMSQKDVRFVQFPAFAINPAYVTSMYKQPAEEITKMYPCSRCEGARNVIITHKKKTKAISCPECKETGINLKLLGYED